MNTEIKTHVAVLGSGPAGYSAAFRCADLGLETVIIERHKNLGGVCLNVGCIPSKTLLHMAKIIEETKKIGEHGIFFEKPKINLGKVRIWKEKVINQLTNSLFNMAKRRKVQVIHGSGKFTGANTIVVKNEHDEIIIHFRNAIIAAGSCPIQLPLCPNKDPRIWNSRDALELKKIPERMLIIGGGIIGLEIGTIYHALGSEIEIVEIFKQVIPSADKDISEIFTKCLKKKFNLMLETRVTDIKTQEDGVYVSMEGEQAPSKPQRYDTILIAIGRMPNSKHLDIRKAGIEIDEHGFICVDKQLRTNISHIFAVGDIVGQPMLAHKGICEGHIAAEVISGMNRYFDPKVIPSIAYTIPEIAWVGLTEKEAKERGIGFEITAFSWASSGRAVSSNCTDGVTKLIFDKKTHRIIGGAIVGNNSDEILGEIGLAIEMGCYSEDIALTMHAHPTLHESIKLAAEIFEGNITDLPNNRKMKKVF